MAARALNLTNALRLGVLQSHSRRDRLEPRAAGYPHHSGIMSNSFRAFSRKSTEAMPRDAGPRPQHPAAAERRRQRRFRPPVDSGVEDRKRKLDRGPISRSRKGVQDSTEEFKRRRRVAPGEEGGRRWVSSSGDFSSYKDRFVVVSYNILGVDNASKHADLYENVEPDNLNWEKRKRRICKELRRYSPSVICLQEVDHFDDLAALLQKDGFTGVYKGRTGEAADGCALFWRERQFALLQEDSIEFQKFGLRNNVAQLCVFKTRLHHSTDYGVTNSNGSPPAQTFVVGNIHVLFNPNRGDIKLGQMRILLERAHSLSQKWGNCPVVIAGDLNSMPQSALYQFLSSSKLDIRLHDRRRVSSEIEFSYRQRTFCRQYENRRYLSSTSNMKYRWSEEEILLAVGRRESTHLQHSLNLCSAYPGVPGSCSTRNNHGEPLATSYHSKFMGTVDYIWHSQELVPVRVLDTLPIGLLRKTGGLPSQKWGSDHLALVCELAFRSELHGVN